MKREQLILQTMSDLQLDHAINLLKREHGRRVKVAAEAKSAKAKSRKSTARRAAAAA